MTHDDEADFHRAVRSWLAASFVEVGHEPTLESGRRPDFVARTPFHSYVIEVESAGGKLYEAIGQAHVYAEETGLEPVAVFPAHDAPDPSLAPDWLEVVLL